MCSAKRRKISAIRARSFGPSLGGLGFGADALAAPGLRRFGLEGVEDEAGMGATMARAGDLAKPPTTAYSADQRWKNRSSWTR
jgi:hypothetical protein